MNEFNNLAALIVEPQAGMRGSIHTMLNLCGITKVDHAVSASTAIRPLRTKVSDLILCEYDLAEGQDGQQFLEDLRHHKIIPLSTIFFMVTAERSYQRVVSAAELTPTDYLLKPFTADALSERVVRALERRAVFMPVYHLMDQGDLARAIKECETGETASAKFAVDFMRLRAELYVTIGRPEQAQPLYEKIISIKAVAWAKLGLAKTLFMQEHFQEAEELLGALISESSRFLDAYDWLAKTQEAIGKLHEAKTVLGNAVSISPHTVRRLRKLGEVAMEAGDADTAEHSFQQVVSKARYSEFRDPEDHVRLVKSLVVKGDTEQAAAVIRDMSRSLSASVKTPVCRAFSSAIVHEATGNADLAVQHLNEAVEACRDIQGLSNDLKISIAKSCLDNQLEQEASEVMLEVMNNADARTLGKAVK
ncbi:MAG: response regulator, partial [Alphaproteobacteria bacterium]|nr:response regulator [Alphaproteobacteria bacterium]